MKTEDIKTWKQQQELSNGQWPTDAMLVSARDWSYAKYGKPIGNTATVFWVWFLMWVFK